MAVTSSGTATVTLPTDEQILITREFAAPKHLVYKAWTTPELVRRWWHAKRGEMTVAEIDLRVGGKWRYVMVTEDGFEVAFHGEYREIVPSERIVSTEVYEGAPQAEGVVEGTLNTLTFAEADGRTTITILVDAPSKEIRDAIIDSGMEAGMQDAMDLLEEVAVSLR
ncbi:MAG: SRPBCC family protein [Gaiellales bacterium]